MINRKQRYKFSLYFEELSSGLKDSGFIFTFKHVSTYILLNRKLVTKTTLGFKFCYGNFSHDYNFISVQLIISNINVN